MAERWRIRKGDTVFLLAGKDKGKSGVVLKVLREERRVFVQGVNLVARHQKPSAAFPEGGVHRREASVHISNVAHLDPDTGKPTRVGVRFLEDGKRMRYAKVSGQDLDV